MLCFVVVVCSSVRSCALEFHLIVLCCVVLFFEFEIVRKKYFVFVVFPRHIMNNQKREREKKNSMGTMYIRLNLPSRMTNNKYITTTH